VSFIRGKVTQPLRECVGHKVSQVSQVSQKASSVQVKASFLLGHPPLIFGTPKCPNFFQRFAQFRPAATFPADTSGARYRSSPLPPRRVAGRCAAGAKVNTCTAYLLKWTYAGQRGCGYRSGGWSGLPADLPGVPRVVSWLFRLGGGLV
jgi:hypothetical protein